MLCMMKKYLLMGACALALSSCGDELVEVNYKVESPVELELFSEGYFSTYDLEGEERIGTITGAFNNVTYESKGDTILVNRDYVINRSRGYLKNFMPSELVWRIKNVKMAAVDREVTKIEGLEDGYDTLLNATPMPTRWRAQLMNPDYKPHLKRLEKHRWEMDHLLKGPVPTKGNVTALLKDRGRLNFALIAIDSVVMDGFQKLDKRECLAYTIYLHEKESFPYYIWEQHVGSNIVPDKFKAYQKGHQGDYDTEYWVAIDPTNGVPCQEREVKVGTHTMVNPATNDTATFKSHVTLERLYNLKRPVEE